MKFTRSVFAQVILDLDCKEVTRPQYPSKEEVEAAREQGIKVLDVIQVPVTVQDAVLEALRCDLSVRDQKGNLVAPDPHEQLKDQLYVVASQLIALGKTTEDVHLTAGDIRLVLERVRKRFPGIDIYGFVRGVIDPQTTITTPVSRIEAETTQSQS